MTRYRGEGLPSGARIAVVSNDAIGNYVVVTPLLQMLRATHTPSELVYFSGPRTQELWSQDPTVDKGYCFFGPQPRDSASVALSSAPFDLVVNVEWSPWAKAFSAMLAGELGQICGPSLSADGRSDLAFPDDAQGVLWQDTEWVAADLTEKYPFLTSGFIAEIFCQLAYLDGPIPRYSVASDAVLGTVPDVLVAMSASLPEKLWTTQKWSGVFDAIRAKGLTIGLLGAPPSSQRQYWRGDDSEQEVVESGLVTDLRGKYSLPQVVGALGRARLVLTLDNGILHLAAATSTPVVGLYRHGIHRLWTPPFGNVRAVVAADGEPVSTIEEGRVLEEIRLVI